MKCSQGALFLAAFEDKGIENQPRTCEAFYWF